MRQNWIKRSIAILAMILAIVIVSATVIAATDTSPVWSKISLQDQYTYGATFTIPTRSVTVGTETVEASASLTYPDGTITKNAEITLTQQGMYYIEYSAKIGQRMYKQTESFIVPYGIYSFNNEKSSASYGRHHYSANTDGLNISLAEGDKITFTQIIDLNKLTENDVLLEAFVTPQEAGLIEFRRLLFTFTDVEDPSNYLRISARQSAEGDNYSTTYFLAGGDGQPLVGWEEAWNRLHIDNEWGQQAPHTFSLIRDLWWSTLPAEADLQKISIHFNPETLCVFTGSTQIVDLDNPTYFTELWDGFTSGKVRLSIEATDYVGEVAHFCVSKVFGIDLSAPIMVDDVAPEITIDTPYETMPTAKVGYEYPIPTASAHDMYSGKCEVDIKVYTNYNSSAPRAVRVVDGKFKCESALQHAIEYTSRDLMGNVTKKVLYVDASASLSAPELTLHGSQSGAHTVGVPYKPLDYSVQSFSGNAEVKIYAVIGNSEQEISAEGFIPDKEGTYTIKYVVTDYIGQQVEKSYTMSAVQSDKPIFIDTPIMPDILVSGYEYSLPELYAYDYRSGQLVKKEASAVIVDADGERTVAFGGKFTPNVKNSGDKVSITYQCEGATLETIEIPAVLVWNENGELDLTGLFYSADSGMSFVAGSDNITATANASDAGWTFANYMVARNFDFQLQGISGKSRYSAIEIIMRDSIDPSVAIKATIVNNASGNADIIVDGVKVGLGGTLNNGFTLRIGYDNGSIKVGNARLSVKKTIDGKDFAGFPSNKLQLSVRLVGATKGDAYKILEVNSHAMTDFTLDRVGPKIVIMGGYGGSFEINEIVTIPAVMSSDVVVPYTTLTMTVLDPDGNPVTAVDGTLLKDVIPSRPYDIKTEKFGTYSVRISSADGNAMPNTSRFNYALNVADSISPEIKFEAGFHTELKVGDALVIPKFNVSDNMTATEALIITKYVYSPSGLLITIPANSNALIVGQTGEYEVRIIVMDEAGNLAVSRTTITVSDK